jgi:hypothetical protein
MLTVVYTAGQKVWARFGRGWVRVTVMSRVRNSEYYLVRHKDSVRSVPRHPRMLSLEDPR